MLERVNQEKKKKIQVTMDVDYVERLRRLAFDANMTQGLYIQSLLDREVLLKCET